MARVPIANPNVDRTSSSNYPGAQGGSHYSNQSTHDRNMVSNNSIAEQVINSPAYRSAHQVLSQETDKSWLQRLEMIPYSVQDASNTFLDDLGLSNNFNDKQNANYQYCMEQISALMAEYQSWKNSLPVNQVQQLADAGVNSAITGQGVNGSSIPNVGVSSNPSTLQSTNVGNSILNCASFVLDATNGLASIALQFKNLALSKDNLSWTQNFTKDQATIAFRQFASANGIKLYPNFTFDDIVNGNFDDPLKDAKYSDNLVTKFLTHHRNSPLMAGLAYLYPDYAPIYTMNDELEVTSGIGGSPIYLDSTNKALIALYSSEKEFDAKLKKYTLDKAHYDAVGEQYDADTSKYNSIVAEKEKRQAEIFKDFLNRLYNSKNETDKLLLMHVLFNATYNTVELEQKENDWFTADKAKGIIDVIF